MAYLREVTALAESLIATEDPYEVALDIHGVSAHAMIEVDPAGSAYLIWGELTNWVELEPDEHEQGRPQPGTTNSAPGTTRRSPNRHTSEREVAPPAQHLHVT